MLIPITDVMTMVQDAYTSADLDATNLALVEMANPEGTLANAKYHTGKRAGAFAVADTILAALKAIREDS